MCDMFNGAFRFNQPLDKWNVSNVTNMLGMFSNCYKFNQPLNTWDVSNVIYMDFMFSNANRFNQSLNNWKISNKKSDKVKLSLFTDNNELFKNFGGDMETLFNCCKKVHSKRLLCIEKEDQLNNSKKNLNNDDVLEGIELFKNITDKNIEKNVHDICPYLYT